MPRTLALLSALALFSTAWPLVRLYRAMRGTSLLPACVWSMAAVAGAAVVSTGVVLSQNGTILWANARLLSANLLLAPLIAVFGARRGTAMAWNLIVAGLLVILALPMLEQSLLKIRVVGDRVVLDGPRVLFYAIIASAGVLNYMPTRFGPAAGLLGTSLWLRIAAIGPWDLAATISPVRLGQFADLITAAGIWVAFWLSHRPVPGGLPGAWIRFRDAWGLVWAARLRDRWNSSAAYYEWTIRIGWNGQITGVDEAGAADRTAAVEQFAVLVRRFADPAHFFADEQELPRPAQAARPTATTPRHSQSDAE